MLCTFHFRIPHNLGAPKANVTRPLPPRSPLLLRTATVRTAWLVFYVLMLAAQLAVGYWLLRECWKVTVACWDMGNEEDGMVEYIKVGIVLTIGLCFSAMALAVGAFVLLCTTSGMEFFLGWRSPIMVEGGIGWWKELVDGGRRKEGRKGLCSSSALP